MVDFRLLIVDCKKDLSRTPHAAEGKRSKSATNDHPSAMIFSKSPNSSNRNHTADTSTCSGSRKAGQSSLGNTGSGPPGLRVGCCAGVKRADPDSFASQNWLASPTH